MNRKANKYNIQLNVSKTKLMAMIKNRYTNRSLNRYNRTGSIFLGEQL